MYRFQSERDRETETEVLVDRSHDICEDVEEERTEFSRG